MCGSPTRASASGRRAAQDSYLNIPALLAACEITGADAVHPGYGFLSENARFAEILGEHGSHFIGPQPEHIRLMGDKIEAKRDRKAPRHPVVPGSDGAIDRDDEALAHRARDRLSGARQGGGRRRRARHEGRAQTSGSSSPALGTARAEAKAAFGDDTVYLEKYLEKPRHIEIQVLGDGKGDAIHLGERDCSLQRRHQKVWEESPLPRAQRPQRARDRRDPRRGHARDEISRRRHGRVPLRERRSSISSR